MHWLQGSTLAISLNFTHKGATMATKPSTHIRTTVNFKPSSVKPHKTVTNPGPGSFERALTRVAVTLPKVPKALRVPKIPKPKW